MSRAEALALASRRGQVASVPWNPCLPWFHRRDLTTESAERHGSHHFNTAIIAASTVRYPRRTISAQELVLRVALQVDRAMSLILPIESALGRVAIVAIAGYQRYLSPYKGFVCAHRVWHGGLSCSQYARHIIATEGLRKGLRALRSRFGECRAAAGLIRGERTRFPQQLAHREFDNEFDLPSKKSGLEALPAMSPEPTGPEPDNRNRSPECGHFGLPYADCGCPGVPWDCGCPPIDLSGCDLPIADCGGCDLPVDCCSGL